jgi:hypothetical protein
LWRAGTHVLVFSLALGLTTVGLSGPAAATVGPSPKILSIQASPHALPAAGGTVTLTVRASNALTCTVTGQSGPFLAQGRAHTVACGAGSGRVQLQVGANKYPMGVRIQFEVTLTGTGHRTTFELVSVAEAAAAATSGGRTGGSTGTTGGGPLTVDTAAALPSATVGIDYNGLLAATGGTPPYTWTLTGGALPAGLSLDPSGEITGTPGTAGSYPLTVRVTDAAGATATATVKMTVAAPKAGRATSINWSGYVVGSRGVSVGEAAGNWTVPSLNCSVTPNAGVSIWVGIGGAERPDGTLTGTLLQTGTTEECINGVQVDRGFTEEYPNTPAEMFRKFPVGPGNRIKASVYQSSDGAWVTRVDNLSTGISGELVTGLGWGIFSDRGAGSIALQGRATNLTYGVGYSAEWIIEDDTSATSKTLMPFADFGTVRFTGLTTSLAHWSLAPSDAVTLVDANGSPLATPSGPGADGFAVSYTG